MFIVFVLIFISNVIIKSSCSDPCLGYTRKDNLPQLCITVNRNNEYFSEIFNTDTLCEYKERDYITLKCERKENPLTPHVGKATLVWKLKTKDHEIIATNITKIMTLTMSLKISIILDRFDHNLIATCEATDTKAQMINQINVHFSLLSMSKIQTNYTMEQKYTTEGQPVQNTLNHNVVSTFPTVAVVASIVGLLVFLLVAIGVHCKYCKKKPMINDDDYEHIYVEPLEVAYAQIYVKTSDAPAPSRDVEPYAKIIGVLKSKRKPTTNTGETKQGIQS